MPAQESALCMGAHWTEDQANMMMKSFASLWDDLESWNKRAERIKQGIITGMQLEKMPDFKEPLRVIIRNEQVMDGYTIQNIALESFPGFYVTGNLYTPNKKGGNHAAILSPHGHLKNKRFTHYMQKRCAVLARNGGNCFGI